MDKCDFCGKGVRLAFKCKRCGGYFCDSHRIPENHNCKGLKKRPESFIDIYKPSKHKKIINKKINENWVSEKKDESVFETILYKIKKWFNFRKIRHFNFNKLFMNILWLVIFSITILIIYSNLDKLNEVKIIFLQLGGLLLFINIYYWLKYFFKLLRRISNLFNIQRNWIKYSILILIIILLFFVYNNRETIFDEVVYNYEKIEFNKIFPIKISDDNILKKDNIKEIKKEIIEEFDPDSENNMNKLKDKSIGAFNYINSIRKDKKVSTIRWDDRVYELGIARVKDMHKYIYMDHTNPITGSCPDNIKRKYGLYTNEYVAENVYGIQGGYADPISAIDSWMTSRGHRYNLLYPDHKSGAIACYKGYCVFLGLNKDRFGQGCYTSQEGLAFWNSAKKQPGEI